MNSGEICWALVAVTIAVNSRHERRRSALVIYLSLRCGGLWFDGSGRWIFGDCGVEHGVELGDVADLGISLLGDDEDGRGLGEADALAQSLVGMYLGGEEAVRINDEGHHATVRLEIFLRECVEVFLRGDGHLVGEDGAAILFSGLGGDLVLNVAGRDGGVEAPDVHAEGKVVAQEGNFVLVDGRVHDGEGVGAGGAFEVFKLVDGDRGALGGAEHGGVFEALSEGRDAGRKGKEQGCCEEDAVHWYKTHRFIFCILADGGV
jgi:hypothetical protein